ncbi:hypothetical protein SAMN05216228_10247 [Rhizobium tibeticum]|uniref:Uncharacterized protein n=1 Tax=Rhizobium tibeticum TaxID=501024 RepID=A0A1H8SA12_9HYPH|nr:hypothetical protein RTCCBAU85039_4744 [Rhizobium tibeticum]SEO75560.1 hypothetical protein SAMN05216228_10247 [Rhizobium tibeticum]
MPTRGRKVPNLGARPTWHARRWVISPEPRKSAFPSLRLHLKWPRFTSWRRPAAGSCRQTVSRRYGTRLPDRKRAATSLRSIAFFELRREDRVRDWRVFHEDDGRVRADSDVANEPLVVIEVAGNPNADDCRLSASACPGGRRCQSGTACRGTSALEEGAIVTAQVRNMPTLHCAQRIWRVYSSTRLVAWTPVPVAGNRHETAR